MSTSLPILYRKWSNHFYLFLCWPYYYLISIDYKDNNNKGGQKLLITRLQGGRNYLFNSIFEPTKIVDNLLITVDNLFTTLRWSLDIRFQSHYPSAAFAFLLLIASSSDFEHRIHTLSTSYQHSYQHQHSLCALLQWRQVNYFSS